MSETAFLPASKVSRHGIIAKLLAENVVRSQSALQSLLEEAGLVVTQATLSRDLEELAATKVRDQDGNLRYVIGGAPDTAEIALPLPGSLQRWCAQLLVGVQTACNQVVLHTPPAAAPALAAVIDKEGLAQVMGCIAGDDTILVICDSTRGAKLLADKLRGMVTR